MMAFISTKITDKEKKGKRCTNTHMYVRTPTCTHACTHICTVIAGSVTSGFAYTKRIKHFLDTNLIFSVIVLPYVLQDISKQSSACYLFQLVSCMLFHAVILFIQKEIHLQKSLFLQNQRSLINVKQLFIFLTVIIISSPLYLKSWYALATVFLFNNLQPSCLTAQFKTSQTSH